MLKSKYLAERLSYGANLTQFLENKDIKEGVGVLITDTSNKILAGERSDGRGLCGPGGSIQQDETIIEAVIRETEEEFGITPTNLQFLGRLAGDATHKPSYIFTTNTYKGVIQTDNVEMFNPKFYSKEEFEGAKLFKSFGDSLSLLPEERIK